MKDYDKNKESSNLEYWDVNDLCGWAMSQKLPVNNFEWKEDTSQFNEELIKKKKKDQSNEGCILDVEVQFPEKLHGLHNGLPEIMKFEKVEQLVNHFHENTECHTHRKFKASIQSWIYFEKKFIESSNLIKKHG